VTSGEWLGLHPLLDGSLMLSAGPKILRVDPAGVLHDEPALLAGIELPWPEGAEHGAEAMLETINEKGGWPALQIGGTWPGATFLTLLTPNDHEDPADVYRWAGTRWKQVRAPTGDYVAFPRVIRAWRQASLLAWREIFVPALDTDAFCSDCPDEFFETPQYKAAGRTLAGAKQLVVLAGPARGPAVMGAAITAFDALPTGEVFLAAEDSILVIAPSGEQSKFAVPPELRGRIDGLVAWAPDDVVGFGAAGDAPYLVRFDGSSLTPLPHPPCTIGLASLSIAGETWWTSCANPPPRSYNEINEQGYDGSLWRREGAGPWQPVALPNALPARVVHARGPDDVWVSAYGENGGTVLHTKQHGDVIALGDMLAILRRGFFPRR